MRQLFKTASSTLFVDATQSAKAGNFRLDVSSGRGSSVPRYEKRLVRYIAAGGMRQLRRTHADDVVDMNRRLFGLVLAGMFIFWLIFYVLPSGC